MSSTVRLARRELFQSTPPRRGRHAVRQRPWLERQFQSTPPRRGRRDASDQRYQSLRQFQSTPPRRGRPDGLASPLIADMFQSTPPRRGRLDTLSHLHSPYLCFNPRPRAGGDAGSRAQSWLELHVSIHAPARGATTTSNCLNHITLSDHFCEPAEFILQHIFNCQRADL